VFGAVGGGVVLAEGAEGDVAAMRFGAAVLGVIFHPEADPAGVKAAFADRVATGGDALPPEALERMYTSMVPGFLREARG
jgi:GMP synthase-like glutamine amidotransferase